MAGELAAPESLDDIYLARGGDVEPFRPLLQGDVFREITIPGVELAHAMGMVISHPCNMRAGPALRKRLRIAPVTTYEDVPFERWPTSHTRVFPLPELDDERAPYAARFDEVGMVRSAELMPERRVACLSERGILLLQQRLVFSDTRAIISIPTLERASAPVLAEAELLEEWNERCLSGHHGDIVEALAREAAAFDDFLSTEPETSLTLRAMLRDEHRRAHVRRLVREEIARREGPDALGKMTASPSS